MLKKLLEDALKDYWRDGKPLFTLRVRFEVERPKNDSEQENKGEKDGKAS